MVSTGAGVTTCAYWAYPMAAGSSIARPTSPTRLPAAARLQRGYVWPIHPGYDVFSADTGGGDLVRLTDSPGYDAEATFSRDGSRIVFTSVRTAISISTRWTRTVETSGADRRGRLRRRRVLFLRRRPDRLPRPSPHRPRGDRRLRGAPVGEPRAAEPVEIWVMNADGSGKRPRTANGAAELRALLRAGRRADRLRQQHGGRRGRNFDLYMIDVDGSTCAITFHPISTRSRCSAPTHRSSCGPRTATGEGRRQRTSSSPTGSDRAELAPPR